MHGAVPGGDSNGFSTAMMYNYMAEGSWAEEPIEDTLRVFFNVSAYDNTAFNVARLAVLQARMMVLGGEAGR